jgi:hypothetical protein
MSKIVIFINGNIQSQALIKLKSITSESLAAIKHKITNKQPIFNQELFDNDYDQKAKQIRSILKIIDNFSIKNRIYELPENEQWTTCKKLESKQINATMLLSILNDANQDVSILD